MKKKMLSKAVSTFILSFVLVVLSSFLFLSRLDIYKYIMFIALVNTFISVIYFSLYYFKYVRGNSGSQIV
jgi:hypothetical protein